MGAAECLTHTLSSEEATVCRLLADAAEEIDQDKLDDSRQVLLFTSGEVSDKLLGTGRADVDEVVNNMRGDKFATQVSEHSRANMDKCGLEPGRVSVFESNPLRSKLLDIS